jgi:flagellar biosynthesis protein FliP
VKRLHSLTLLGIATAVGLFAMASPALAQQFNLDLGEGASSTGRIVQLIALITVLSLAPAILVTVTSFTRIVVVLSFLRQALGTQSAPPNMVVASLALFLTGFVMMPTLEASYQQGIQPLLENKIDEMDALERAAKPLHAFMIRQVRDQDLRLFMDLSHTAPVSKPEETPLQVLIPAFMISELRRAFEIGFLIFLPFLIIDMLVASVLMSMGMMMLPPATFALPFKLIFFVLVDGWYLVAGSLVQSFST